MQWPGVLPGHCLLTKIVTQVNAFVKSMGWRCTAGLLVVAWRTMSRVASSSRSRILFGVLLILAWGGALLGVRALRGPAADPAADVIVRPEFAGAVGANLEPAELTGERLDRLAEAGIGWVRFTLAWDAIEPARGQFDWTTPDAVFAALAQRPALRPVVVLDRSPKWARGPADAENPAAPPHERADFGAFAAAVARRYGGQVRFYQVWHEPNIAPHWGARPADPADYAGLLREAAIQLRSADADARIVLAALAPTTEAGPANLSELTYLDRLYSLGARAWFDSVAVQPYGFTAAPAAAADPGALNFGRAALVREVMLRHGDGATPLWATAFGWNALPAGWTGPASPWGAVGEADQARYAADALAAAATQTPWLGPLFWAADCPTRAADDPWRGFALCAADGADRPVWEALRTAARPPAVLPPGRNPTDHPALRYDPGWRVTATAADPGQDGDALEFAFNGTGLALAVQGGPYWALYRIAVDGQPANALPRDETGAAYLVLHDPFAATRRVTVARGLAAGEHQVRLEATGGWGQWALQGIIVTSGAARSGLLPWLLIALAGTVTAIGAVWAWRWRRDAPRSNTRTHAAGTEPAPDLVRSTVDRPSAFSRWLLDAPARLPEAALWAAGLALAGLLVLSRWLAVDLLALAGLGWLFVARPDLSLPLIAASLPFWQQPKRLLGWEFGHFELFLWVAVLALVARWALGCIADCQYPAPPAIADRPSSIEHRTFHISHATFDAVDFSILALLLAGLASTLLAAEQGVAWREFRIVFLFGAVFYALITRVPWPAGRRPSPWPLVGGLVGGLAAASLIGLGQLVTGQGLVAVEGVWRVRALYGSPNNLALVLDRGVPLALALAAFGRFARPTERVDRSQSVTAQGQRSSGAGDSSGLRPLRMTGEDSSGARPLRMTGAVRFLFAAAAGLMLLACIATFSKGAMLLGLPAGIGIVLLGGAWRSGRRWPLWAAGGLALLAVAGLALLFRTPRFADLFNFQAGTSFVRIKLWQGAWRMALDHPLLGVGPDNFLYAYRTHYVLPSAWEELNLSHPHNIFLDLWTRLGLIGAAAGGWALTATVRAAWRAFRGGDQVLWPLALGLLAGLAATLVHGLIDNSLFLPDLMGLFVVAAGLLRRRHPVEYRQPNPSTN